MKIAALVVTHNRKDEVVTVLDNLLIQTRKLDFVLVVDNGSDDGTSAVLSAYKEQIHVITQNNRGGAGGFSAGLHFLSVSDYDWIWCMDDNGYPAADALDNLINTPDFGICVKNCLVLDSVNKNTPAFYMRDYELRYLDSDYIINHGAFMNGTLIHRTIIQKVGLPLEKLFIWGDEIEYFNRICNKYHYPVITVTKSLFYHPSGFELYSTEWDPADFWKIIFFIRNLPWSYRDRTVLLSKSSSFKWLFLIREFYILFKKVLHQSKHRTKKLRLFLYGILLAIGLIKHSNERIIRFGKSEAKKAKAGY